MQTIIYISMSNPSTCGPGKKIPASLVMALPVKVVFCSTLSSLESLLRRRDYYSRPKYLFLYNFIWKVFYYDCNYYLCN